MINLEIIPPKEGKVRCIGCNKAHDSSDMPADSEMPTTNMEKEKKRGEKSIYVEFRVKTTANAAILLAPCRGCDGYEIVLGMRGDTVSVIRQRKRRPTVAGTKSV